MEMSRDRRNQMLTHPSKPLVSKRPLPVRIGAKRRRNAWEINLCPHGLVEH